MMHLKVLKFKKWQGHLLEEMWYMLLVFLAQEPYIQINPLNACKLYCEENPFDFYVESIAFRIKILINITSIQ